MNLEPAPTPANNKAILKWGTATIVVAIIFFFAGFLVPKGTTDPVTVEKEVIKTEFKIPAECHEALVAYESYGKNLDSMVYSYKEFVSAIENELNGIPTPKSTYEAYGMTIGLSKSLADEQAQLLESLIPSCNKYL